MSTQPDPADAIPTDNSAGAPVDERLLDEAVHSDGESVGELAEEEDAREHGAGSSA